MPTTTKPSTAPSSGDVRFIWCPEGVDEADARLLGDVAARRVLEVGSGAAQCARWLRTQGADVVAFDLSHRQLQHARRIDDETGISVPAVQATVSALPFAVDLSTSAFSAFGALSFVVDITTALAEVRRVLRPGGRFVFSVVHPSRWMFPDDPTQSWPDASLARTSTGLPTSRPTTPGNRPTSSRTTPWPTGSTPSVVPVCHLEALIEPEWPDGHDRVWGGWGPERGALVPGTMIFAVAVCLDADRCPGIDVLEPPSPESLRLRNTKNAPRPISRRPRTRPMIGNQTRTILSCMASGL